MPETLRAVAALSVVLAILLAGAFTLRRFLLQRPATGSGIDLAVLSWRGLDTKRKLALIRWNKTEYLLCLGPAGDFLIDQRVLETAPSSASDSGKSGEA